MQSILKNLNFCYQGQMVVVWSETKHIFMLLIKGDLRKSKNKGLLKMALSKKRNKNMQQKRTFVNCHKLDEIQLTFLFSLYSRISWCNVSQFGTHPINPLFGDNGITEYLRIDRSFSPVFLEFSRRVFTKPKS